MFAKLTMQCYHKRDRRVYQMGDDSHLYRDATEKVVVKSYI